VGYISGSANIQAAFHFLPQSIKNISSDRCSGFPDSPFQVLTVVNTNTVDDLLHIPPEIKIDEQTKATAPTLSISLGK
jgi:hypothetical protein